MRNMKERVVKVLLCYLFGNGAKQVVKIQFHPAIIFGYHQLKNGYISF